MPASAPEFVDLHLHAEGLSDADLATLAFFGLRAALTCAHDAGAIRTDDLRRHWDELVTVQAARLQAAGIRPLVALGVHPARIPWHGIDALLHDLPRYFDDPRVVALGELGLGTLLIVGFLTPVAALLAFVMVLQYQFASGALFTKAYFYGQSGLVYLMAYLVIFAGRAGQSLGLDGAIGRSMQGGGGPKK